MNGVIIETVVSIVANLAVTLIGVFGAWLLIYLGDRKEIIRNIEAARNILCDTSELEEEKKTQADERNVTAELIHKLVGENARVAIDQKEFDAGL